VFITVWVVRNYVSRTLYPSTSETMYPILSKPCPLYSRNQVPYTLETMYYVPQAWNYVPSTLEIVYFHQKFDKKVENPNVQKLS